MNKKINNSGYKVLLAGGHASATAYAVIEEIKKQNLGWNISFIGSVSSVEGKKVKTLSSLNLKGTSVEYYDLYSGRLQKKFSLWTIPSLLKIPIGFFHAYTLIHKIKPNALLSFGGYSAFPVVFWARLLGIPIILHEQTSEAGRANLFSSFFADKIALSRESSLKYFNEKKCVLTGNPISLGVRKISLKDNISRIPVILVTGGSAGSFVINSSLEKILPKVLKKYKVIHQTGQMQYEKFKKIRRKIQNNLRKNYQIYSIVESKFWPDLLKKADIVISRAGANITSEIMCAKIPTIFIPIPFSQNNEQMENARYAKKFGIAEIIEQKKLNSSILLKNITKIEKNWVKIRKKVKDKICPDHNASENVVFALKNLLFVSKK